MLRDAKKYNENYKTILYIIYVPLRYLSKHVTCKMQLLYSESSGIRTCSPVLEQTDIPQFIMSTYMAW